MELITNKISLDLKKLIKLEFHKNFNLITEKNSRINHVNIFHKDWGCTSQSSGKIISILQNDYSIDPNCIVSLGFINSQINSYNQHFHIDYEGKTETYFIPLIDLTDVNGTEYVEFINREYNINILEELVEITDKFINRDQITKYFNSKNITSYKFKYLNGAKLSMVKMPYYLFHRGQSNQGTKDRTMFQIIISKTSNCVVSPEIKVMDSELDENNFQVQKLLTSRKLHTST